jgi:hypothetical protein
MNYVKDILGGVAAIFIAQLVCSWSIFSPARSIAIGLDAVGAMSVENLLSPVFWIIAGLSFGLFFVASRAATPWRVLFFWIPTLTVSALGFAFVGMCAYIVISVRHQYPH